MQTLPSVYDAYSTNGIYYEKYSELYNNYNINISDKTSAKSQLMVGMCIYAEFSSYSWGDDEKQVVNHMGEGSVMPENYIIINEKKIYKNGADWELAPSTLEILYYRDEIAKSCNSISLYNNVYY